MNTSRRRLWAQSPKADPQVSYPLLSGALRIVLVEGLGWYLFFRDKQAMPNGLYMIFATAVLMITGCASSGLAQPSINESALPASRGYHAEPLRFERWSYLYSDDEAHHLTYRWHVGA